MPSVVLIALTGLLTAAAFPPYSQAYVTFFALVPLLIAAQRSTGRQAFVRGWCSGIVFYAVTCSWVLPTIARFEQASRLQSVPFFALFITYQSLQFALFAVGVRSIQRGSPLLAAGFVASWWVLLEWLFPRVLPWYLGDRLVTSTTLRQCASFGGVYGLSFLLAFVNGAVAIALIRRDEPGRQWMQALAVAAIMMLSAVVDGAAQLSASSFVNRKDSLEARHDLTVGIVQGGVQSGRDDIPIANLEALGIYAHWTELLAKPDIDAFNEIPDLIVWPETTLRVYLRQDEAYRRPMSDLVHRIGRPLLIGSLDRPASGSGELNSAYLIEPGASRFDVYHKSKLLPFGEYVPGASMLPWLHAWKTTGQFVAGEPNEHQPVILDVGDPLHTMVAPSICFEAIWPGAFNRAVREGAALLVNLTDDGWFGRTAGPLQHLEPAQLRAVETRRWLIRASNSGVSAFIDPNGDIVDSLPVGAMGTIRHSITPTHSVTFYVRYGDWPVAVSILIILWFGARQAVTRGVVAAGRSPSLNLP